MPNVFDTLKERGFVAQCTNEQELHDLFFKMRDNHGQTIVIVTHDEQLASRCDRSLTLKDGVFI